MQKIKIFRLGPIKDCEVDISNFMILTGPQASGKSTLAKSIFFFKNVKNILFEQIKRKHLMNAVSDVISMSCEKRMLREIRAIFLQTFGTTWCMDNEMKLQYFYGDEKWIKISLKPDPLRPNYIWIDMSPDIKRFLNNIENYKEKEEWGLREQSLRNTIDSFFEDEMEIVYIPAGRSLITLFSDQLNYVYGSMDDMQKRNLDYCTQNYLERILRLKTVFTSSYTQMIMNQIQLTDKRMERAFLEEMVVLMQQILKGEYVNVRGEERLQVSGERYVKINFASSGQQEVVWILNVLFYYLLNQKKAYFIIEEPESHLFPDAQKKIAQFISAAKKGGNKVLVTTHSPYILGEMNNLLYANRISKSVDRAKLKKIIKENQWIEFEQFAAYYLEAGKASNCVDDEFQSIENEIIDGASDDINKEFSEMLSLEEE